MEENASQDDQDENNTYWIRREVETDSMLFELEKVHLFRCLFNELAISAKREFAQRVSTYRFTNKFILFTLGDRIRDQAIYLVLEGTFHITSSPSSSTLKNTPIPNSYSSRQPPPPLPPAKARKNYFSSLFALLKSNNNNTSLKKLIELEEQFLLNQPSRTIVNNSNFSYAKNNSCNTNTPPAPPLSAAITNSSLTPNANISRMIQAIPISAVGPGELLGEEGIGIGYMRNQFYSYSA